MSDGNKNGRDSGYKQQTARTESSFDTQTRTTDHSTSQDLFNLYSTGFGGAQAVPQSDMYRTSYQDQQRVHANAYGTVDPHHRMSIRSLVRDGLASSHAATKNRKTNNAKVTAAPGNYPQQYHTANWQEQTFAEQQQHSMLQYQQQQQLQAYQNAYDEQARIQQYLQYQQNLASQSSQTRQENDRDTSIDQRASRPVSRPATYLHRMSTFLDQAAYIPTEEDDRASTAARARSGSYAGSSGSRGENPK